MLANRNIGRKATESRNSTTLSTANARLAKIRRSSRGLVVASSTLTNTASSTTPATIVPQVAGSSQPQVLACCSPSTASPMPAAISTAPRMSSGAGRLVLSGFARSVRNTAIKATGMFTQKIARQVHSLR